MCPPDPSQLLEQALQCQQAGDFLQAEQICRQILSHWPAQAEASHQLGLLLAQRGDFAAALAQLQQALSQAPDQAFWQLNYARVLAAAGELVQAERACRRALELEPQLPGAHLHLANILKELGQQAEALVCYRRAIALQPKASEAYFSLGNTLRELGRLAEAVPVYTRALQLAPQQAELHNNLAACLHLLDRPEAALEHYQMAVRLKPDYVQALHNLAKLTRALEQPDAARGYYDRLLTLEPDSREYALARANLFQRVPMNSAEIADGRRQLCETVNQLLAEGFRPDVLGRHDWQIHPSILLAYHGQDDLALKLRCAELFKRALPQLPPLSPHSGPRRQIGFVVTGHESLFLKWMGTLLQRLPDRFEITVICRKSQGERQLRAGLAGGNIGFLPLQAKLPAAIAQIRQARFDLLYYWESGTDSLNYFLPFFRLARVQCNGYGWPISSGAPEMDVYLSSDGLETASSDGDYSERLIRLSSLLTCQARPRVPERLKGRDAYGLPEQARIYLCCQDLAKVHPDYDQLATRVLSRDPKGLLLILGNKQQILNQRLLARLNQAYPELAPRMRLLPYPDYADFLNLLALADVILDSLHFSGASTNLEAFACATPVVTLPGRFQRGRYTLAFYRAMGISEAVASDADEYVELALGIAGDPDRRARLSGQIRSASAQLFENPRPVQELSDCFDQLLG
ncbi:MAG: tetratricopeptide repeat protein [Candidatus Sericytochromatia bacterium]